jgi:hypothetical protein
VIDAFIAPDKYLGVDPRVKQFKLRHVLRKTMVELAVVFGSETWAMTERDITRLDT